MILRGFSYYKDYKSRVKEKERNKKGEAMPLPNDDTYIEQM